MRIARHVNLDRDPAHHRRRMLTVLQQPRSSDVRPCRGCAQPCLKHGSPTCACGCDFKCPYAPAELSSDSERYPIEPRILPLVFELSALRIVQPCWSCEGHEDSDGSIRKLPSVWFYVDETEYAVMLNQYLLESYAARRTHVPWIVTMTSGPEDLAFACRPDLWASENVTLEELQEDAFALAAGLLEYTHDFARDEIMKIDRAS